MVEVKNIRYHGNREAGMRLQAMVNAMISRVRLEMMWQNLPQLRRAYTIPPNIHAPMGGKVYVSCIFGIASAHVYVPFVDVTRKKRRTRKESMLFLHIFIQGPGRTSVSLLWDIEANDFLAGTQGVAPTSTFESILNNSEEDYEHLYGTEEVEVNEWLQDNTFRGVFARCDDFHFYLGESGMCPFETSGLVPNVPTTTVQTYQSPCWGVLDWVACVEQYEGLNPGAYNEWAGPPEGTMWGWQSEETACDYFAVAHIDMIFETTREHVETDGWMEDTTGALLMDGEPAKFSYQYIYPAMKTLETVTGSPLIDGFGNGNLSYESSNLHTKVFTTQHTNYRAAFLLFRDFLWHEYNNETPAQWDEIRGPILPSFSIDARNSQQAITFHVETTLTEEYAVQGQWSLRALWYDMVELTNTRDQDVGSWDRKISAEFEMFTPVGSIGVIRDCEIHEVGSSTTLPCAGVTGTQSLNAKFFYGRPSYMGAYNDDALVQVYAYDYNLSETDEWTVEDGGSWSSPIETVNVQMPCGHVEESLRWVYDETQEWGVPPATPSTRGERTLLVGASAVMGGGDPRGKERSEKLEEAIRDLFDLFYETNSLDVTRVDDEYEMKLELRVGETEVEYVE